MAELCDVVARVVSQQGTCAAGHKVGDEWVIGEKTPEGICLFAFSSLLPAAMVLSFGGSFPWEDDPEKTTVACPDATNPLVIELRRVPK